MKTLHNLAYGPDARQVLDLFLPEPSPGGVPGVVCIHGGGWTSGDKTMLAWTAPRLTAAGMAVACVNYRLCPEWLFPAALDDVQRAVRWLRHHAGAYGLDGSRLGSMGNSAGGHLAAFLALAETRDRGDAEDLLGRHSSRVSCVVDCYGPVDLVAIMHSASAPIIENFLGKELRADTVGDFLAASPITMIAKPVCPFLILHGTEDVGAERGQVPIGIGRHFASRLREAGGEADFVAINGAGHGFMAHPEGPYAHEALSLAEAFFRRHLRP
jgi:acetyl esterase/lipase